MLKECLFSLQVLLRSCEGIPNQPTACYSTALQAIRLRPPYQLAWETPKDIELPKILRGRFALIDSSCPIGRERVLANMSGQGDIAPAYRAPGSHKLWQPDVLEVLFGGLTSA